MPDMTHRISKKPPPAKSNLKSRAPNSIASDRTLTDVPLLVEPVHLPNIPNRQKSHEYRKYRLRDGVTRLWFYEIGDGGRGRASITCVNYYLNVYFYSNHYSPLLSLYCPFLLLFFPSFNSENSRHIAVIPAYAILRAPYQLSPSA